MKKILFFLMIVLVASCQEVITDEGEGGNTGLSIIEGVVPAGFDWSILQEIDVKVRIADQYAGKFNYFVELLNGGLLLDRGFVVGGSDGVYTSKVVVPKIAKDIILCQVDPNGNKAYITAGIVNGDVSFDFTALKTLSTKVTNTATKNVTKSIVVPENLTELPADGKVVEGKKYIVSADKVIKTRSTSFNNIELYVYGTFETSHLEMSLYEGTKIFVLNGAKMDVKHLNTHGSSSITVERGATLNVNGSLLMGSSSSIINDGEIEVENILTINNATLTNTHFFKASEATYSTSAKVNTSGQIFIKGVTTINTSSVLTVGSFGMYKSGGSITLNASKGSSILLDSYSKLVIGGFLSAQLNTSVQHSGKDDAYAVVMANEFIGVSKKNIKGKIVMNLNKTGGLWFLHPWGSSFPNPVITGNPGKEKISIKETEYNDIGYNPSTPTDPPVNPGPDKEIEFLGSTYRVMFEDNYPVQGDYDMNDIVVDWRIGTLKNSENIITKVAIEYTIQATGCSKRLGGALSIDNLPVKSAILSESHSLERFFDVSNGLESDNSGFLVVPLFDDVSKLLGNGTPAFINVSNDKEQVDSYTFVVEMELETPIQSVSYQQFSFFIIVEGNRSKRIEIFPYGGRVTAKASNTAADFTLNDHIFGLQFNSNVKYPTEAVNINTAYPKLEEWVSSDGINSSDWYNHPASGKVYTKDVENN